MIYERCKSVGIDIAKDWIPVVPAQHYLCGGVSVDKNGKTSIENLFACGECSQTGLHGANRLASNSLLEALVYSAKIYEYLTPISIGNNPFKGKLADWNSAEKLEIQPDYLAKIKTELQLLMRQNAGIVRYEAELPKAKKQLLIWKNEIEDISKTHQISVALYELLNMITIGSLIVQHSIDRKDNRGGFMKVNAL